MLERLRIKLCTAVHIAMSHQCLYGLLFLAYGGVSLHFVEKDIGGLAAAVLYLALAVRG